MNKSNSNKNKRENWIETYWSYRKVLNCKTKNELYAYHIKIKNNQKINIKDIENINTKFNLDPNFIINSLYKIENVDANLFYNDIDKVDLYHNSMDENDDEEEKLLLNTYKKNIKYKNIYNKYRKHIFNELYSFNRAKNIGLDDIKYDFKINKSKLMISQGNIKKFGGINLNINTSNINIFYVILEKEIINSISISDKNINIGIDIINTIKKSGLLKLIEIKNIYNFSYKYNANIAYIFKYIMLMIIVGIYLVNKYKNDNVNLYYIFEKNQEITIIQYLLIIYDIYSSENLLNQYKYFNYYGIKEIYPTFKDVTTNIDMYNNIKKLIPEYVKQITILSSNMDIQDSENNLELLYYMHTYNNIQKLILDMELEEYNTKKFIKKIVN